MGMMNNKLTVEQIKAVLVQSTEQETKNINLSAAIRAALVKFEGKKITARMESAVRAEFPGSCSQYQLDVFFCQISVWGGNTGRDMNNRFTVYFGGYHKPNFSLASYDEKNASCGSAAIERNAGRAQALARPELLQAVADAANAVKQASAVLKVAMSDVEQAADKVFSLRAIETLVNNFCGGH